MANKFTDEIKAALEEGAPTIYVFVAIMLEVPIYLTTHSGDISLDGNTYTSSTLVNVTAPPRTGKVTQEVQRIAITETLADFTNIDFISRMGDSYHGAKVVIRTIIENISGDIHSRNTLHRSEGIVKHVSRDVGKDMVILEVTNSYGKLDALRELRTTSGSLTRYSSTDTSFDEAAAVDNNVILEWGT